MTARNATPSTSARPPRRCSPGSAPSRAPGGRGRLRVYLGMAPGVGKTYRMLEEGHRRVERGTDLVVGFVEAHGRPCTRARCSTASRSCPRRGSSTAASPSRRWTPTRSSRVDPTVALVDELAHTNAPGSARAKRWEDVEVDPGRRHPRRHDDERPAPRVASPTRWRRSPAARSTSGSRTRCSRRRRDRAGRHEPARAPPADEHGNVYPPERTEVALDRFFTEANLTALRELALRLVARRVEGQLEASGGAALPLATERVLVLVDGQPSAARAVRRAAGVASAMHASLVALVIETPRDAGRTVGPGSDRAGGDRRCGRPRGAGHPPRGR